MKKTTILVPLLAFSTVLTSDSFSSTHISANTSSENPVTSISEESPQGLIGYYFNTADLKTPSFITTFENGNLSISSSQLDSMLPKEKQQFQSAIWKGRIKATAEGEYTFSISENSHVTIWINNQEVTHPSASPQKIKLKQGKLYDIKIKYQPKSLSEKSPNFTLYWTTPDGLKEVLPNENVLLPEMNSASSKSKTRSKRSANFNQDVQSDELLDRDNDGILDSLEIEGYTTDVKNKRTLIVPWMEELHAKKGLTKYTSSPEKWSTASDPYSDFAKVTGRIDKLVSPEARNPLVAAYPIINVNMEKIILSKNRDMTSHVGGSASNTLSMNTSTSNTNSTSISAGAELNASLFDFGVKVSTNFTTEHSSTVAIEHSKSNTNESNWSTSINVKEAEAAYLGAGLRYINTGTAPIYQARPTATLALTNAEPIATVTAKENQTANHISPGSSYPGKGKSSIILNTRDDFSSTPISLNLQQLDFLEKEKQLKLDTDQVNGKVGIVTSNGSIDKSLDWDEYIGQIKATSTGLLLDTGEKKIERRVAAINPDDPLEATKPEMTLKQALKLAFGFKEGQDTLQFEDKNMESFEFILDEETAKHISNQLKDMEDKNIYKNLDKIKLYAQMNIKVALKIGWKHDKKTNQFYYFDSKGNKVTGNQKINDKGELTDNGDEYQFDENGALVSATGDAIKNNYKFDSWKKVESPYTGIPDNSLYYKGLYFNVSEPIANMVEKYKVFVDNKPDSDNGVSHSFENGKLKVEYNQFYLSGLVQIYAITKDGSEILVFEGIQQ